MAIDPRLILLAGKAPDIGGLFGDILTNIGSLDKLKQDRLQAPLRNQLLQAQITAQDAATKATQEGTATSQGIRMTREDEDRVKSIVQGANELLPFLKNQDIPGALSALTSRKARIEARGGTAQDTDEAIQMLQTNPSLLLQRTQQVVDRGQQLSLGSASAPTRTRAALIRDLKSPDKNVVDSAMVALNLKAPVRLSKDERIVADPDLAESIVTQEGNIAGAKKGAQLQKELSFKPRITRATKLAEKEATERGEVLTDLSRMKAALPGLQDAISQLRELAPIATSTLLGRAFDATVRETGFGTVFGLPKGATARAKYISIINNQVLPLLKPTFGAQFTEKEGETLKATMGDPNVSPEEKLEQLDAFIEQKIRSIETAERQLEQGQQNTQEVDLTTLTIEQLMQLKAQNQQPQG